MKKIGQWKLPYFESKVPGRGIVSVKEENPQWDLLGVPGIENLPGVRWKLQNIRRMAPMKHP